MTTPDTRIAVLETNFVNMQNEIKAVKNDTQEILKKFEQHSREMMIRFE